MTDYTIIIQARMGSNRRPGKINYLFDNEPMLMYQINRLKAFNLNNIIIATSDKELDDITADIANKCNVECFRGSEDNVLKRFNDCCKNYNLKNIIRVGGDDPLVDPEGIKLLINTHKKNSDYDLIYTSHPNGWIYGTAAELITTESLYLAHKSTTDKLDTEHIIPYYKKTTNVKKMKLNAPDILHREDIYLSVDYQEDLDLIEQIIFHFSFQNNRYTFKQNELIKLYDSGKLDINNKHLHNGF